MFCITHLQCIPRKDSFENSQNKAEQVSPICGTPRICIIDLYI